MRMRGENLFWVATIIILALTVFPPPANASPTKITVSPIIKTTDLEEEFTIKIYVEGVTNLFAWGFRLDFNTGPTAVLEVIDVREGPFLKDHGETNFGVTGMGNFRRLFCMFSEDVSASGSGELASIDFKVTDTGDSDLRLSGTELTDPVGGGIAHTTQDGSVYTESPVACFAFSPDHPETGETVSFSATCSFAPGGGEITDCAWDFGDGSPTEHGESVTHAYTGVNQTYEITLTVTVMPPPLPGDVDGDGDVDSRDLFALAAAYGSKHPDPRYNPDCDFDGDGDVDSRDLFTLAPNYGKEVALRTNTQKAWIYVAG